MQGAAIEAFFQSCDPGPNQTVPILELEHAFAVFDELFEDGEKESKKGAELLEGLLLRCQLSRTPSMEVSLEQLRTIVSAYVAPPPDGKPARDASRVLLNFQELSDIRCVYAIWAGSHGAKMEMNAMNTALSVFNKCTEQNYGEHHFKPCQSVGRMIFNYYDRLHYHAEIDIHSATRWMWDEIKVLEEDFQMQVLTGVQRLKEYVWLTKMFECLVGSTDKTAKCKAASLNSAISVVNSRLGCSLSSFEQGELSVKEFAMHMRAKIHEIQGIDMNKILEALQDTLKDKSLHARVIEAFRLYDVKGKGVIAKPDLIHVMNRIYEFQPDELALLMEVADTKKDGLVDYAQFTAWVLKGASAV